MILFLVRIHKLLNNNMLIKCTNTRLINQKKYGNVYMVNENSLDQRILRYIKSLQQCVSSDHSSKDNSELNNETLLQVNNLPSEVHSKNHRIIINNFDLECRKRLPEMPSKILFSFLLNLIQAKPQLVKNLPFYSQALHKMSFLIEHYTQQELIQLCYFLGVKKKTPQAQQVLRQCLNKLNKQNLDKLMLEDIIVICNAAFKTSTKITQKKILEEIQLRIYNHLDILQDESYFVTLVKSLRHNRNYDEELLRTISNVMFFNKTVNNYNFTAISHILALYADALYYDDSLMDTLCKNCIKHIKNAKPSSSVRDHFSSRLRLKDVSRYLWSTAYLGYEGLETDSVLPLLRTLTDAEGEGCLQELTSCLLSLSLLGNHPADLLARALTHTAVLQGKRKMTFVSRLNLLLTCIAFENKDILNSIAVTVDPPVSYNVNSQIVQRPHLAMLLKCLQSLSNKSNLECFKYSHQIPHLNIVGIVGFNQDRHVTVCIECIDDLTGVKHIRDGEYSPHGFMKLKLRLLLSQKWPLILLHQQDITEKSQSELQTFLEWKLKKTLMFKILN